MPFDVAFWNQWVASFSSGRSVITKKITEADTEERRQGVMLAVRHGSVGTWQHLNLHGEYDFADEKLQDSIRLHASVMLAANVLGQWEALVSLTR